jgi:hypothetical protein
MEATPSRRIPRRSKLAEKRIERFAIGLIKASSMKTFLPVVMKLIDL